MPATRRLRCISSSTCSHPLVSSTSRLRTFSQARPWSVGTLPPCLTDYTHSSKGSIVSPVDCTPALLLRCHTVVRGSKKMEALSRFALLCGKAPLIEHALSQFPRFSDREYEVICEQRESMQQQAEPEMHNSSDAALYDRYALLQRVKKILNVVEYALS